MRPRATLDHCNYLRAHPRGLRHRPSLAVALTTAWRRGRRRPLPSHGGGWKRRRQPSVEDADGMPSPWQEGGRRRRPHPGMEEARSGTLNPARRRPAGLPSPRHERSQRRRPRHPSTDEAGRAAFKPARMCQRPQASDVSDEFGSSPEDIGRRPATDLM